MKVKLFIFFIFLFSHTFLFSQQNKFESRIKEFEQLDSLKFPQKKANLFVGSSSIALWESIEKDYQAYKVINRGFGGSGLMDLEHFASRIITNYEPSKIFIYSGENDIGERASAEATFKMFKQVFEKIRSHSPLVSILFISIKPSYARLEQMAIQKEANKLIKAYIEEQKNAEYVDIVKLMLKKGLPDSTLFIDDKLHMNAKGYKIWTKKLKSYLVK